MANQASDVNDASGAGELRRRSAVLVDGPNRAAARSQLHSVGFMPEDLRRPLVMVAHSWIGTMPCNFSHRELAQDVMRGCGRRAGRRWR